MQSAEMHTRTRTERSVHAAWLAKNGALQSVLECHRHAGIIMPFRVQPDLATFMFTLPPDKEQQALPPAQAKSGPQRESLIRVVCSGFN